MTKRQSKWRCVVLVEDQRSRQFFRLLLRDLGVSRNRVQIRNAPRGKGSAEAWILKKYAEEVKIYRAKNYQKHICLMAVRDGDKPGFSKRKKAFDQKLQEDNQAKRSADEAIATLIPTWSIETWLLALLDESKLTEKESQKEDFTDRFSRRETQAIQNAVKKWRDFATTDSAPLSLKDGDLEIQRLFK